MVYPRGSLPSRLYGNPKMHKVKCSGEIPPLRPIVSSIGAYNYKLAKFLDNLLSPYVNCDFACADTFTFVNEIQNAGINNDNFIVSYDVVSLFTNIPLKETLEIAVDTILKNKIGLKITKEQLLKLFTFATSGTHFSFNDKFYEQVDGVAMGSPLAPRLANLFLGYHEGNWIENYAGVKPLYYKRYVDDVIAVFNDESEAKTFLDYLNTKHANIKFTMEIEKDKKLAFLDVLLDHSESLVTSIYRKATFTGLMTNYFSFTPMKYKIGLVKCLVDRCYKINNTRLGFDNDLTKIFEFLQRNCFPKYILNKITKKFLDEKSSDKPSQTNKDEENIYYFKLPYLGKLSLTFQRKLRLLCEKYCKKVDVRIVFQTCKLKSFFSTKDKVMLKSHVVYKFCCARCKSCYVGFTKRHYNVRVHEHLNTDSTSHIYKHLKSNAQCRTQCDESCFEIIDHANTEYELRIKEALHIHWIAPEINKQKKSVKLTLTV